jgi:hypothetical protein
MPRRPRRPFNSSFWKPSNATLSAQADKSRGPRPSTEGWKNPPSAIPAAAWRVVAERCDQVARREQRRPVRLGYWGRYRFAIAAKWSGIMTLEPTERRSVSGHSHRFAEPAGVRRKAAEADNRGARTLGRRQARAPGLMARRAVSTQASRPNYRPARILTQPCRQAGLGVAMAATVCAFRLVQRRCRLIPITRMGDAKVLET